MLVNVSLFLLCVVVTYAIRECVLQYIQDLTINYGIKSNVKDASHSLSFLLESVYQYIQDLTLNYMVESSQYQFLIISIVKSFL